ncbi:MAG: RnfABCDGE type electron transport complex subunit G [Oscillospiraceae bacterium]|nr:RnfABCDGE type electron transport complex subunit G [Oscillospiraceae bacterium]
MTEEKKSLRLDWATLRLAVILFAFAAVVAVCLGLINYITHERIDAYKAEKTAAAMESVLPADEYTPLPDSAAVKLDLVKEVYAAGDHGWVVMVAPSGFGGEIDMAVGVDKSGTVTGISIIDMSETSGLGANAGRESFRSQFSGRSGSVALSKEGGEIDALTGATVTSSAVVRGVNAAISAAAEAQREEAGK